jgi:tripartite-type tricarboxylate transporter receptor subunit TctC
VRLLVLVFLLGASAGSFAQPRGVDLYIGYSVGGGYDIYARLLARHMGRHLPGNPTVVPRNMEGAGSLRLANWLYKAAPRDGSAFGTIGRAIAFEPLFGEQSAQFKGADFGWIGSANDEVSVCAAWGKTGIARFEDLYAREVFVGGTGGNSDTDTYPRALNSILGTKMKLVTGYPGGNDITLAMQRGEVQARCGWSWSSIKTNHPAWVKDGTLKILAQLALEKHPDLPQVPLIMDMVKTPEQRSVLRLVFAGQVMGRPFLAPPGLPAERVELLRRAFDAMLKDRDFLAEIEKTGQEFYPASGEQVQKLIAATANAPRNVVELTEATLRAK